MPVSFNTDNFTGAVDAFRAWSRWPGRDEERLRILVEGERIKTTLLYADTGKVPSTTEHNKTVERMWVDISGYVVEISINFESGVLDIVAIDDTSALITLNEKPLIHLVQGSAQSSLAEVVIGLDSIPKLEHPEKVKQMTLVDVNEIEGIERFSQIEQISFRAAVWLTDLTPMSTLSRATP